MSLLRVEWTITPKIAPRPWLNCNRCGGPRPFASSDKIRTNASGKRIDAWLIYKCSDCDNSWNRPLLERRNIGDIDPSVLAALHGDSPAFVRRAAFDIEDLRRRTQRVEEFAEVEVTKRMLSIGPAPLAKMEIALVVAAPTCVRLDRLLASELRMSRARVQEWRAAGRMDLSPHGAGMLRRPVRDGTCVRIDKSGQSDAEFLRAAITGCDAGLPP